MAKLQQDKATPAKKVKIRAGRPLAVNAGEVTERLLHAATDLFLQLGFEATSCDLVAARAGAGKGSLYARFANKEELFTAAVRRAVANSLHPAAPVATHLSLTQRLRIVGVDILHQALRPEALSMMRLVIATATRFPELAQLADKIGWEAGVQRVAEVISLDKPTQPDALAKAESAASWFISLTFAPQQMRALLGDSQEALRASAPKRVDEAINILAKSGWFSDWK